MAINPLDFPLARKLRIPRGGWPSGHSEYVIEEADERVRFRYVMESFGTVGGPEPFQGPLGLRRRFCRVEGRRGAAVQLFEELPNRPA